ncbi:MAG: RNA polymerase sigma factor [Candidatus Kerfeldbacteria bacterium]|nr:RNA polymerase sigma factor [Candidatus Kerfeldbacteria bacterium]
MNSEEEKRIVKQAQAGNEQAITVLYNQYITLIYRYVYIRVGNQAEAEDVTQDAFLKVFQSIGRFEFRSSFKTWLFTIVKATIVDLWRKKYKEMTVPLEDFLAHEPGFETDPEVEIEEVKRQQNVEEAIRRVFDELSDDYRKILELRFLKGYTLKEAAAELGISVNNAKVRQFRALEKARALTNGTDPFDSISLESLPKNDNE